MRKRRRAKAPAAHTFIKFRGKTNNNQEAFIRPLILSHFLQPAHDNIFFKKIKMTSLWHEHICGRHVLSGLSAQQLP